MPGATGSARSASRSLERLVSPLRRRIMPRMDELVVSRFSTLTRRGAAASQADGVTQEILEGVRRLLVRIEAGEAKPARLDELFAQAFGTLYDKNTGTVSTSPEVRTTLIDQFHRLFYHSHRQTWDNTTFLGTKVLKCPLDLWVYQEMLYDLRPDLIIETGTFDGGSAFFLASMLDLIGNGHVVTIDVNEHPGRPEHPRITYMTSSSTDPEVVSRVAHMIPERGKTLVILDSDHSRDHVLQELRMWHALVTVGSYLIVEDTNINSHPVYPQFGPGPMEALADFLKDNDQFEIDDAKEKFLLTFNPRGYLKRVS